jgi:hypothetical protein
MKANLLVRLWELSKIVFAWLAMIAALLFCLYAVVAQYGAWANYPTGLLWRVGLGLFLFVAVFYISAGWFFYAIDREDDNFQPIPIGLSLLAYPVTVQWAPDVFTPRIASWLVVSGKWLPVIVLVLLAVYAICQILDNWIGWRGYKWWPTRRDLKEGRS